MPLTLKLLVALAVLVSVGTVVVMMLNDRRPTGPQEWRCTRCGHRGTSPFDRCYQPSQYACPLELVE